MRIDTRRAWSGMDGRIFSIDGTVSLYILSSWGVKVPGENVLN